MSTNTKLVVFRLDSLRYALPLVAVERIVRAVEVTRLPSAPGFLSGMIDVEGRVLPVVNLRRSFGLPERAIEATDQFLIAHSIDRSVVLVVDEVIGLVECDASAIVKPSEIAHGLEHIQGVVMLDDGMVMIHDLETLLTLHERRHPEEFAGSLGNAQAAANQWATSQEVVHAR